MSQDLISYYHSQASQKRYLDALLYLADPQIFETVLDIGTGSGTVTFCLADRVKKIVGIDPNPTSIEEAQTRAQSLTDNRDVLPHFNVAFVKMAAEETKDHFAAAYFDTVVCWGSVHHFKDYQKAMKGIRDVSKPGGKLIIFDAFFPEPIRDFWELASTIHDPTTVRHHTYFEYMEMLRQIDFKPKNVIPFRHTNDLDLWLATIEDDDSQADAIRSLHPGKYDQWLESAYVKGLKLLLKEEILNLSDEMKHLMSIKKDDDGRWRFTYDTFVLMAEKEEQR